MLQLLGDFVLDPHTKAVLWLPLRDFRVPSQTPTFDPHPPAKISEIQHWLFQTIASWLTVGVSGGGEVECGQEVHLLSGLITVERRSTADDQQGLTTSL